MDILVTLIPIFGIIFLGMIACRVGFLSVSISVCLNQFTYKVGLPALLFSQLAKIDIETFPARLIWGTVLALSIMYVISYSFFICVLQKEARPSVILTLLSNFYNAGFMGIPIVVLLFPDDIMVIATSSIVTILTILILLVADIHLGLLEGPSKNLWMILKKFFFSLFSNPLFSAPALGAIWNLTGVPVPTSLMMISTMLGATAAPCALFCIGMILMAQLFSSEGFVKGWFIKFLPVHITKLIIQPMVVYYCLLLVGESGRLMGIVVLMIAMPTGITAYIIAEKYTIYVKDTSLNIFVNTALSGITIPCAIVLLRHLGIV